MNARVLKSLELISFNGRVELTQSGKFVKTMMGDNNGE